MVDEEEELPPIEPIPIDPDEMEEPKPIPIDEEPISLAPSDEAAPSGMKKIQAFGGTGGGLTGGPGVQFKRPVNLTGAGATRCKTFHSKIAVAPMEYMENQINEWLDANEIEVKAVTQVVGVLEGKTPEPNIIVMVWY